MRFVILFLCLIFVNINVFAQTSPPPRTITGAGQRSGFISKADGFQISFPAKPTRTVSSIDTAFGKTDMINYKLATAMAFYSVNIIDFPTIIDDKAEIDLRFEAVKANLLKDRQSRLINETEISFGGNLGREFVLESADTTLTIRGLFIKQRFFQLTVATKGSLIKSSERVKNFNKKTTDKFIDSFSVDDVSAPAMTAVELPKDFGVEIKDETFSSRFFGFSVKIPESWNVLESEQTEVLKDLSKQKFESSTRKNDVSSAFSLKNTEILLIATKTDLEASVGGASFSIAAERVSFPNFVPLKMIESYAKNYLDAGERILKKPSAVKLNGVDFAWLEVDDAKLKFKKRFYIANRKGIALEIFLMYQSEEDLKVLLDALQSVKFD